MRGGRLLEKLLPQTQERTDRKPIKQDRATSLSRVSTWEKLLPK